MKSYLIKPLLNKDYPMVEYGKGIYLYDIHGKEYMDGCSGAVTASIGHGVPEIAKVMKDQGKKVSFVYRSQFTSEPAEKLAFALKKLMPGNLNWTFFVNSGSEATETALKVALQYWQEKGKPRKTKIISRWISYHGITLGSLSMSGHVERRKRFIPLLENFPSVEAPYCYRCPFQKEFPSCNLFCANELEKEILRIGSDQIAAFIAEPIIGASGAAIIPPQGYYEKIRDICNRHEILFIADEVMTGLGRCGKSVAIEYWNVLPDIVALGKGLSGGYAPLAAVMMTDEVMDPILNGSKLIMSGHTYSANPQSTRVGLAVIEYMEKYGLFQNSRLQGEYLLNEIKKLQQIFSIIGDVRGKGLFVGIEFVSNIFNKLPFSSQINVTQRVVDKAMEKGLLVYPAGAGNDGLGGSAIIIAPPLNIKKEEIDKLIHMLKEVLKEIQDELQSQGLINSVS